MTTPTTDHPALCPACGATAIREVINHMNAGSAVIEATFLCEYGHNFLIRWLRPEHEHQEAPCPTT